MILNQNAVHLRKWPHSIIFNYMMVIRVFRAIRRGIKRMNKEIRPLEFGVAVALSLGGIGYSIARSRRNSSSVSSLTRCPSDEFEDDYLPLQQDKHVASRPRVSMEASNSGISPSIRSNCDRDGMLSPIYDDLEDDDAAQMSDGGWRSVESDSNYHGQEIKNLRNNIKVLKERERGLEVQLLEYYGLKEQETAVMELQNRLKINNVEAKLFNLKIESLQADNQRLQTQVQEYTKVVTDLEAAKSKVKHLKRKFRSKAEQHREQLSNLQKKLVPSDEEANIRLKLQRLKELEEEAEELRKLNHKLQTENTELAEKLEYVQILANSVLEEQEIEKLREESEQLKKRNEDLTKEIEQVQVDRCADVEELVYLRWVNACLRYELRNYQQGQSGKNLAKDNNKMFSPKSEEKAKQLILEYATNKEGEKMPNINELDFDQWSSSQASYPTDSGETPDESLTDSPSLNHKSSQTVKRKFFTKLKNLLKGKESKDGRSHHSRASSEERNDCFDDETLSQHMEREKNSSNNKLKNSSRRRSLDIPKSSSFVQRLKSVKSGSQDESPGQEQEYGRKIDIRKSADFSRLKPPKRSASVSSF